MVIMRQRGISLVGIIIVLAGMLLLSAYSVAVLFATFNINDPVNTSSWNTASTGRLSYSYPKWLRITEKIVRDDGASVDVWEIPSLQFVGQTGVTGQLLHWSNTDNDSQKCREENKDQMVTFKTIQSQQDGVKCVFVDTQHGSAITQGKTYIYNFHDAYHSQTVTLTVTIPPWTFSQPHLEQTLDTIINSMTFQ